MKSRLHEKSTVLINPCCCEGSRMWHVWSLNGHGCTCKFMIGHINPCQWIYSVHPISQLGKNKIRIELIPFSMGIWGISARRRNWLGLCNISWRMSRQSFKQISRRTFSDSYTVKSDDSVLPVLIIGAGPVGLVLSILLTKLGIFWSPPPSSSS